MFRTWSAALFRKRRHFGWTAGLLAALLSLLPRAHAQQLQMRALAASTVSIIHDSKQKSVVVMDFEGPGESVTKLGLSLADQLSDDLTQSAAGFSVTPRPELTEAIAKHRLARSALRYSDIATVIAHETDARIVVLGQLTRGQGDTALRATIDCYRLDSGKELRRLSVELPLTDELQKGLSAIDDISSFTRAGHSTADGMTPPKCQECPNPPYTQAAAAHHVSTQLFISAVIGTDGSASDIYPLKDAPYGLNWSAANAIAAWKFKPAIAHDGNPMAVRQEVKFVFNYR